MYALVIEGVVSLTSKKPRPTAVGEWLPLVEDETTFSTFGEQTPNGFTVEKKHVVRHWRQVESPDKTIARLEAKIASLQALTATPEAVELAVQEERITTEQAVSLGIQVDPPVKADPIIGGRL